MTLSDGPYARPIDPDDEERRRALDDDLDLARLMEEREARLIDHGSLAAFDPGAHEHARLDVYGVARREGVHGS